MTQDRAKELAAHKEQLEEWKKRFKAEALRQIGDREKALTEWQAQLEGSRAELEHLKDSMEASLNALFHHDVLSCCTKNNTGNLFPVPRST